MDRPPPNDRGAPASLGTVPDATTLADTVVLLKGFADETRLRLLCLLRDGEVPVHDLVEALGLSQSGVSHQLRILHDRHLIARRRRGRHVYYRLADDHVRRLLDNALAHGAERR